MFDYESALIDCFKEHIESEDTPWGEIQYREEFNYQRGKTDIVAVSNDGKVIAFEAKLTKWKEALHQAYRNKCFANLSYVVLPEKASKIAIVFIREFARRGVGICAIGEDGIEIIADATENTPLQPWLTEKALSYAAIF